LQERNLTSAIPQYNPSARSRCLFFDGGHLILFMRQKQALDAVLAFLGAQAAAA
jgi:hypothetical protein